MSNDAQDDFYCLTPTDLDRERLHHLSRSIEGRVEAENGTWVVLKYPTSPLKAQSPLWRAWSLLVNVPYVPTQTEPYELRTLAHVMAKLAKLNASR